MVDLSEKENKNIEETNNLLPVQILKISVRI